VSLDDSNGFHDPADTASVNAYQCVYIGEFASAQRSISVSRSWTMAEVPFVTSRQIEISGPANLTIGANSAIKFMADVEMFIHPGASLSYSPSTIFTSLRDDSVKGDTDGPSTPAAAAGDWFGIYGEYSDMAGNGAVRIKFDLNIFS
jgi:hypothetical protein